jgi:hypothetical protein
VPVTRFQANISAVPISKTKPMTCPAHLIFFLPKFLSVRRIATQGCMVSGADTWIPKPFSVCSVCLQQYKEMATGGRDNIGPCRCDHEAPFLLTTRINRGHDFLLFSLTSLSAQANLTSLTHVTKPYDSISLVIPI